MRSSAAAEYQLHVVTANILEIKSMYFEMHRGRDLFVPRSGRFIRRDFRAYIGFRKLATMSTGELNREHSLPLLPHQT